MAIATASELKNSREAIEAGVSTVTDTEATSAISVAESTLNRLLGYKVANADTSLTLVSGEGTSLSLPQRVRSISAITDAYPGSSPGSVTDTYEIRGSGFDLWRYVGWRQDNTVVITGAFGYATTDDQYILAKQFVIMLAVRNLAGSDPHGDLPLGGPAGGYLTGYSAEGADFSFFTPNQDGSSTGYPDLDRMLDQIGKHPNKSKGLYTVSTGGGLDNGVTFDEFINGAYGGIE